LFVARGKLRKEGYQKTIANHSLFRQTVVGNRGQDKQGYEQGNCEPYTFISSLLSYNDITEAYGVARAKEVVTTFGKGVIRQLKVQSSEDVKASITTEHGARLNEPIG